MKNKTKKLKNGGGETSGSARSRRRTKLQNEIGKWIPNKYIGVFGFTLA